MMVSKHARLATAYADVHRHRALREDVCLNSRITTRSLLSVTVGTFKVTISVFTDVMGEA
jgi:hypothetical protein